HNGSPIQRPFFAYPSGVSSNGFLGQNSDDRIGLLLCNLIVCAAASGLDLSRMVWRIGRMGRFAHPNTARDGLGAGRVETLRLDGDGALWVATAGGLSRI